MTKTTSTLVSVLALALIAAALAGAGYQAHGRLGAAGEATGRGPDRRVASALDTRGGTDATQAVKVAVMELAIVDNSYGGDSDRLRAWMVKEGIEPTGLLREAVGNPSTYAALEVRPEFVSLGSPQIARAQAAKGFEASDCYVTECALAVGRALGADRVITGEITKLSVLIWFVTGRVFDVRTGRLLRSDEFEVKGVIEDLMPKVMPVLARRFASLPPAAPPPVATSGPEADPAAR